MEYTADELDNRGNCDMYDPFEGMSDDEITSQSGETDDDVSYRLMGRTDGIFKICRGDSYGRDYVGADEYGMHYCFSATTRQVKRLVDVIGFECSGLVEFSVQGLSDFKHLGIEGFILKAIGDAAEREAKDLAKKEFQNRRFTPSQKSETNIYLMLDGHTGYIKIGRSKNPSTRERTLQGQVPLLKMIWTCHGINADETNLHSIFSDKRLRGEWFDLNDEDVTYIKSMDWRK